MRFKDIRKCVTYKKGTSAVSVIIRNALIIESLFFRFSIDSKNGDCFM